MGAKSSKTRFTKRADKKHFEDDTRSQTPESIEVGTADTLKTPSWTESDVVVQPSSKTFEITKEELKALVNDTGDIAKKRLDKIGGVERLYELLRTSPTAGLSNSEKDISIRKKCFGENRVMLKDTRSYLTHLWNALRDIPIILLLSCALADIMMSKLITKKQKDITGGGDGWVEGIAILIGVLVIILVTAVDEHSKHRRYTNLQKKKDKEDVFSVLRMGVVRSINERNIVVGDVCLLKLGNLVPADGVIIQSNGLKVDDIPFEDTAQSACKSEMTDLILYAGSNVLEGNAKMLVIAVGSNCKKYFATKKSNTIFPEKRNKQDDSTIAPNSELKEQVLYTTACIVYTGSMAAFVATTILLTQYILLHFVVHKEMISWSHFEDVLRIFVTSLTIIVLAVCPGLPFALGVAVRRSVKKMMREKSLVRNPSVCEKIGNVTTICCDKTGTLTTNRSGVVQSYICEIRRRIIPSYNEIHPNVAFKLVQNMCVNSAYTSRITSTGDSPEKNGSKLECALLEFVDRLGISFQELRSQEPEDDFVHVYGFNSNRKSMSTVLRQKNGFRLLTKGAAELVLERCRWIYGSRGTLVTASRNERRRISNRVIVPMTNEGLRCVTLAYRDFVINGPVALNETLVAREPNWDAEGLIVNYMTCLGIVGIQDPLRPEVPLAVQLCQQAEVTMRMVTGDNVETARAIALQCGILREGDSCLVMDGGEFNGKIRDGAGKIRRDLFDNVWPRLRVLARATPTDKYNLVKGIQKSKAFGRNELVAVAGNGVDDVPALKEAHVAFVMGTTSTQGAKLASDVVITDDNFCSFVRAILLGRNVRETISKCLQFQLILNISTIGLAFIGVCTLQVTPLRPLQMLWITMVMGVTAALAFPTEFSPHSLVRRQSHGPISSLLSPYMVRNVIGQGTYTLLVCVILVFIGETFLGVKNGREIPEPNEHSTVVFNSLAYMSLANMVVSRKTNGERSVFRGLAENPMFCFMWLSAAAAQALVVEFGRTTFYTCPLRWDLWLWSLGMGGGVFLFHQLLLSIPLDMCMKLICWEVALLEEEAQSLAAKWFPSSGETGSSLTRTDSHATSSYSMS